MKNALLVIVLILSCGGEPQPYTWGDLSAQLADDYCAARVGCGQVNEADREYCYAHSYSHLCELQDTCSEELEDQAQWDSLACTQALSLLDDADCLRLLWGLMPSECEAVRGWDPEP